MAVLSSRYEAAHKTPKGPGDARPIALDIVKDNNMINALTGKTILITGTSSGIGISTAQALYATGATLYLAARNLPKARQALGSLLDSPRVHLLEVDHNSLASVRKAADEFKSKSDSLNILVCNAGIMAVPTLEKTEDGFESQFGVCHLSHFLLFELLKPLLLKSSTPEFNSRVVMVSSVGHLVGGIYPGSYTFETEEYSPWKAYGQAKTANIYMANEIERRYGSRGLHANSLMPGGIMTGLQAHIDEETKKDWRKFTGMKSEDQGAANTVLAAIGKELEGVGGKYLEDCHEALPAGAVDLAGSGYAKHAFNPELEGRLWDDSLEMVGLKDVE
ncbi:hypothetical protein V491_07314 [Pseudogymnoascus sp. VKM F-3775]|nr:hypothetical protein V491_07314 [Pseudogymnoascus sp. VKM F-3775]